MAAQEDVLVRLRDEDRQAFKAPLGPVYADPDHLLEQVSGRLITVGDVVSYHVERAGRVPEVAVIDGRSERSAVDPEIERVLNQSVAERIHAVNPAGTLTESLVRALANAISREEPVQVVVDGEEDLAAIPAVLLARDGSSVVYGQPGEGMVHVEISADGRHRARELLELLVGDHRRLAALLDA